MSLPVRERLRTSFGTDLYGRDVLDMIVLGLPIDLEISFAIVLSAFAIGVVVGSVAAYAGGYLDEAILEDHRYFLCLSRTSSRYRPRYRIWEKSDNAHDCSTSRVVAPVRSARKVTDSY